MVSHHPQEGIQNAMEGVTFDYFYSGQKVGDKGEIKLCVTSIITDWKGNIYYRTCRYLGHYEGWKGIIKTQIFLHLKDLGVGIMLVRAMMSDFVVDPSKKKEWLENSEG